MKSKHGTLRYAATTIVLALSFYYIGQIIVTKWNEIESTKWHIDIVTMALSLTILIIGLAIAVVTWWLSARLFTPEVEYLLIFNAWAIPNLAKYIPGGIWVFVGSIGILVKSGQSLLDASAGMALSLSFLYGSGILYALPILIHTHLQGITWIIPIGLVILVLLVVSFPQYLLRVLSRIRPLSGEWHKRTTRELRTLSVKAFLASCIHWIIIGLAFYVFCYSVSPEKSTDLPYFIFVFAAAQTAGFLVLVAPAGLGVREAVVTTLLAQVMPSPEAAVIAVASRIWFVTAEIVCLLIALLLVRMRRW